MSANTRKNDRLLPSLLMAISFCTICAVICIANSNAQAQHLTETGNSAQKNVPNTSFGKLTLADWLRMMK